MTNLLEEHITIGKILKAVGLRGEIKVSPLTVTPRRFSQLGSNPVFLTSKNAVSQACTLENVREHGLYVFLSFREITSREDASRYVDGEVQISRSEVPSLPAGVYYHFDLIGLSVSLTDGRALGKIEEIIETGSNDVFVVRNTMQEYLIPALQSVILNVDVGKSTMIVRPIEGMVYSHAV